MGMTIRVYARRVMAQHEGWDAARFRADIESTLREFVDAQAVWLDALGADAQALVAHARTSVSGGKRYGPRSAGGVTRPWPSPPADESALLRACA